MTKYKVKITGKKTGDCAHTFEGTFGFDNRRNADAFADFEYESLLLDPELTGLRVQKLYAAPKSVLTNRG